MSKHATVEREGYTVPLIGIPIGETLEVCDLCGDVFSMRQVKLSANGRQWLCERCRRAPQPNAPGRAGE